MVHNNQENNNQEKREEVFSKFRDEIFKRIRYNTSQQDKSILSLSSAGLVFTLSIIRFIIPVESANNLFILYCSWFFFVLAIITTIISFIVSNKALNRQLEYGEEYYVNDKEEYYNKKDIYINITGKLNKLSPFSYIIAIILVFIFFLCNIGSETRNSSNDINNEFKGKESSMSDQERNIKEGASVLGMQKIEKSSEIPLMQKKPQSQSPSNDNPNKGKTNSQNTDTSISNNSE